ncbi:MAG: hypothetical protein BGO30_07535 [Bacteroidetes bacterium 41-46]|nr:MAG: hypothetical protein BGO30_07535 [Bacteroidetes bacterium 41-46]
MKTGIELIAEERQRQIEAEGWTAEHDKEEHAMGELALAASCYAMIPELRPSELPPSHWPWCGSWKPTPSDRIRELQKAGALIAAEIDRLQAEEEGEEAKTDETRTIESLPIKPLYKRMFEIILDEMNLDDVKNNTGLVRISNIFISADKVKQGGRVSVGVDEQTMIDLLNNEVVPLLILVNKNEYFKRKEL